MTQAGDASRCVIHSAAQTPEPRSLFDIAWDLVVRMVREENSYWVREPRHPELLGRPTRLVGTSRALIAGLAPTMSHLGIACDRLRAASADMRAWQAMYDDTIWEPNVPTVGLADLKHVTRALQAEFYAAAADFHAVRAWDYLTDEDVLEIAVPARGVPRYAVVVGSRYDQCPGLKVYASRADAQAYVDRGYRDGSAEDAPSLLTLSYAAPKAISFSDLDAIADRRWSVAEPDAYPLLRRAQDVTWEYPTLQDLVWVTGALQVLNVYLHDALATRPLWVVPADMTCSVHVGTSAMSASLRLPVLGSGSAPRPVRDAGGGSA
jgi:hypothetical protein